MAKNRIFDIILKKITIFRAMTLLLVLFIMPTFINYDFNTENRFTGAKISLPYLYAGDQVHYYIMVYSLLKDKDVNVRNNYENSLYNLTYDMGYLFRGKDVGREAVYFNFKTSDYKPFYEGKTEIETPDPGKDYGMIMFRPWGMPLFYYVLLLPFSFVQNPEPLLIFLTVFLTLMAIYLFYLTLNHFLKDERISALFALLLGISSELWHYSKLFYPDVLQLFLLSLIIYLFIVKNNDLIVGILFAIGFFARPTFIILLPFFIIYRFFNLQDHSSFSEVDWSISRLINPKGIKRLLFLLLPVFLTISFQFFLDYYFYGSFFSNPNFIIIHIKNVFEGLFISFLKLNRGLFIFSPIMVFGFFGIRSFYRKHEVDSIFIYSLLSLFVLFFSSTLIYLSFSDTYSIRYYVPIIPYFFIPMAFWYKDVTSTNATKEKNKVWLVLFYLAAIISILINFQAAIFHTLIWGGPPWKIISLFIENRAYLHIVGSFI